MRFSLLGLGLLSAAGVGFWGCGGVRPAPITVARFEEQPQVRPPDDGLSPVDAREACATLGSTEVSEILRDALAREGRPVPGDDDALGPRPPEVVAAAARLENGVPATRAPVDAARLVRGATVLATAPGALFQGGRQRADLAMVLAKRGDLVQVRWSRDGVIDWIAASDVMSVWPAPAAAAMRPGVRVRAFTGAGSAGEAVVVARIGQRLRVRWVANGTTGDVGVRDVLRIHPMAAAGSLRPGTRVHAARRGAVVNAEVIERREDLVRIRFNDFEGETEEAWIEVKDVREVEGNGASH